MSDAVTASLGHAQKDDSHEASLLSFKLLFVVIVQTIIILVITDWNANTAKLYNFIAR